MYIQNLKFIIILLLICNLSGFGQVTDSDMGMLENTHLPGFIKERKPEVYQNQGRHYYLNDSWQLGSITLGNGVQISNVLFRYDIVRHVLEIKDNQALYLLSAKSIDSFYWVNNQDGKLILFEPVSGFYNADEALFGFFEVLAQFTNGSHEYKLLAYHTVWMYPATSSVSLSGSHRSNDIFWKEYFYLANNGELVKLKKKRSENYHLFGPYEGSVRRFARKKGKYFKKREDVTDIFHYYTSLISRGAH